MAEIRFKLKEYLQEHGLKPRDVENRAIELGHNFGRNTIYRLLADGGPERFDKATLMILIGTLRDLLPRRKTKVSDLIEYVD